MYPISITTLLAGLFDDPRAARYLLPLPVIGAGVSVYHLLVENRVERRRGQALRPAAARRREPVRRHRAPRERR
jgi:hypothetical protein